jgi:hypothetical protein
MPTRSKSVINLPQRDFTFAVGTFGEFPLAIVSLKQLKETDTGRFRIDFRLLGHQSPSCHGQ